MALEAERLTRAVERFTTALDKLENLDQQLMEANRKRDAAKRRQAVHPKFTKDVAEHDDEIDRLRKLIAFTWRERDKARKVLDKAVARMKRRAA